MSRPTSQDIIDQGTYLEPLFDPSTLLVANLRAILQHHDIHFAANASKPQLIKLFNENITANAYSLRQEKRNRAGIPSDASDIMDAETGEPLEPPKLLPRRTSRRSTRGLTTDPSPAVTPVKASRRRSTKPSIPRTTAPAVVSDSEGEEDVRDRVRRKIEEDPTPKQQRTRRISQNWGSGGPDSMWTDDNPFQSGPESSPSRRTSVQPQKKSRKSRASAPSLPVDSEPEVKREAEGKSSEQKTPAKARKSISRSTPVRPAPKTPVRSPTPQPSPGLVKLEDGDGEPQEYQDYIEEHEERVDFGDEEDHEEDSDVDSDLEEAEAFQEENNRVARRIANLRLRKARRQSLPYPSLPEIPPWLRLVLGILGVIALSVVGNYKTESAAIGYCDTGTTSNAKVAERLALNQAIADCQAALIQNTTEHNSQEHDLSCGAIIPAIPLPHPITCTPCPPHAKCSINTVVAEPGFTVQSHPLAAFNPVANGLPGFGSIAFPPRVVPDRRLRRSASATAKKMEDILAIVRGNRICKGVKPPSDGESEAYVYGFSKDQLKDAVQKQTKARIADFDDVFEPAIAELKRKNMIVVGERMDGTPYYASNHYTMDLQCKIKLAVRDLWNAYKLWLLYTVLGALGLAGGRSKLSARARETRRVRALVQEALETLQGQEAGHYVNPTENPSPSISSIQLRDLLMQEEHNIPKRAKIWTQVERIVEGNSNVRANMEVMPGGDEGRVWTWVGNANKRVKFVPQQANGRIIA